MSNEYEFLAHPILFGADRAEEGETAERRPLEAAERRPQRGRPCDRKEGNEKREIQKTAAAPLQPEGRGGLFAAADIPKIALAIGEHVPAAGNEIALRVLRAAWQRRPDITAGEVVELVHIVGRRRNDIRTAGFFLGAVADAVDSPMVKRMLDSRRGGGEDDPDLPDAFNACGDCLGTGRIQRAGVTMPLREDFLTAEAWLDALEEHMDPCPMCGHDEGER